MAQKSMYGLLTEVERTLPKIFNCERATLTIVNRWKKYLYRIVRDPTTGVDEIKVFKMNDGIAGFIAITSLTIELDDTSNDIRFNREIDDPNFGPGCSPAHNSISLPLFASEDLLNTDKESMAKIPRAVLHIINKKHEENGVKFEGIDQSSKEAYVRS